MIKEVVSGANVHGRVRFHRAPERLLTLTGRSVGKSTRLAAPMGGLLWSRLTGWEAQTPWRPNLLLYEWATIFGKLLLRQGTNYGIGAMYFEYENVADPDDAVVPPTLTRDADQGVAYYNALVSSSDRDYLRVPIIAGLLQVGDSVKFPKGNQPTFFAQTSGTVGVHGRPFSDANNSKVFGAALVAIVDEGDASQDLVLSRFYAETAEQQTKLASSQIGLEWQLELE